MAAPTRTVGVVGSPIAHSLSPEIHEAAFRVLGLPWRSMRLEADASRLAEVLDWLAQPEVAGCSVTMPLKSALVPAMARCSETVQRLDALNCVVVDGQNELEGHSTDGAGFLAALDREHGRDVRGGIVAVMGAGGAARAVALAAAEAGAEVLVLARREEAAAAVAEQLGTGVVAASPADAARADIVVNATPVGMAGTASATADALLSPSSLKPGALACELVYHPLTTPWLAACRAEGHPTMDGVGMLVHQALIAVELWTGEQVPAGEVVDQVRRSLA